MTELVEREAGVDDALSTRDILWRLMAVTLLVGTSLFLLLVIETV